MVGVLVVSDALDNIEAFDVLDAVPHVVPLREPTTPVQLPTLWVLSNYVPSNADGPLTWRQEIERVYAGTADHQLAIEALVRQHGEVFGFIVLDPLGWVRDGHHRLVAAVRLRIPTVPVHWISSVSPFRVTEG